MQIDECFQLRIEVHREDCGTVKAMGLASILAECSNLNHGQLSLMGCGNCAERHKVWDRQKES